MALFSEIQEKQNISEVSSYNREEEYRRAQQAGAEAVMVGRETLATVVHQGEQLENAEAIADDTVYTVDYANRLVRGMTWSGWLANKFSKPVNALEYRNLNIETNKERTSILKPLKTYEFVPESCEAASQSIQNYHLNLQVFEDCKTDEQKGTCRLICDDMYRQAVLKITEVLTQSERNHNVYINASDQNSTKEGNTKDFTLQLKEDLSYLRQRQYILQQIFRGVTTNNSLNEDTQKTCSLTNGVTAQQELQDQHLNTLSKQIQELGYLAGNISISAEQQVEVVDSLNSKSETLHFKMNVMNRRTEQLIKDKSWGQQKAEFSYYAWIRHNASGRYLSIAPNNDSILNLSNALNEKCIFGVYTRRKVLGLQNKYNRGWVGKNVFGQLTCSANSFNRRQEWEADGDDWSDTTLLVVSGGWGAGGYLLLEKGTQPIIGGYDLATKKQAPKWCISEFHIPS